jgi:hypothetical protein
LQSAEEQHWFSGLVGVLHVVAWGGTFWQTSQPPGVMGPQVPPLQSASVVQSPPGSEPPVPVVVVPAPVPVVVPAPVPVVPAPVPVGPGPAPVPVPVAPVPWTTLPPHAAAEKQRAAKAAREKAKAWRIMGIS